MTWTDPAFVLATYTGPVQADSATVRALIDEAEVKISRLALDDMPIGEWAAGSTLRAQAAEITVRTMVLRVLNSPGPYKSEGEVSYQYTINPAEASTLVKLLPSDWELLFPPRQVGLTGYGSFRVSTRPVSDRVVRR